MVILKDMKWSIVFGVTIVGVSLFSAYICFNILASSASASLNNWKFGGAFAGFIFTALLLSSIILQFYNKLSKDETEKYRVLADELRLKLLKGTEAPPGYNVDVDDKFKLIFARPDSWTPQGGILYQYIDKSKTGFYTNFNVTYNGQEEIDEDFTKNGLEVFNPSTDLEKLYDLARKNTIEGLKGIIQNFEEKSLTMEWISIDNNRSQKYIHIYNAQFPDESVKEMCQVGVFIYVARLKGIYIFTFSDISNEFLKSSEIFNTIINSIRFI